MRAPKLMARSRRPAPATPSLRAKFVVSVRIDRTFVAVRLAAAVAAVRNDR